ARHDATTVVALKALDAVVAGFPLRLQEAASISILDGNIAFENLSIGAGEGVITISGAANPAGHSSLALTLATTNGPAEYRIPLKDGGMATARIQAAQLTLSGELSAAALALTTTVASLETPQGSL